MRICEQMGVLGIIAANTKLNSTPKTVMGIEFPHAVGLAAGLDKNADYADALQELGFGGLSWARLRRDRSLVIPSRECFA